MILSNKIVSKLIYRVRTYFKFAEYGFGRLKRETYKAFVEKHLNGLYTSTGYDLKDIDNVYCLIMNLRSKLLFYRSMTPHYRKIAQILSSRQFLSLFDVTRNQPFELMSQQFDLLCRKYEIPPHHLLRLWLVSNNIFKDNSCKTMHLWINTGYIPIYCTHQILQNKSFQNFCKEVLLNDIYSGLNQPIQQTKSQKFEVVIKQKLMKLLAQNGIDTKIWDEDAMRNKMSYKSGAPTPDLCFKSPIVINNRRIQWIEIKNYCLIRGKYGKHLLSDLEKQCKRYTKVYGRGAVVCRGYQSSLRLPHNTMLLDAFCDRTGNE